MPVTPDKFRVEKISHVKDVVDFYRADIAIETKHEISTSEPFFELGEGITVHVKIPSSGGETYEDVCEAAVRRAEKFLGSAVEKLHKRTARELVDAAHEDSLEHDKTLWPDESNSSSD